jgi:hypothetical protein
LLTLELILLQIERLNLAAPQKLCAKRDPDETGRGHMSSRTKTILRGAASATIVALALFAAPSGGTADERPLFISVGETTRAPIGWVEFCVEYDPECKTKPSAPRDIVLSPQAWKDLVRVNRWVNTTVKPMTDMDHWGVVERWNYPDDGYGDCEDYVLQKRKAPVAVRSECLGCARRAAFGPAYRNLALNQGVSRPGHVPPLPVPRPDRARPALPQEPAATFCLQCQVV